MKIRLYQHPFRAEPPQEFETDSLAEWLLARYEGAPAMGVEVFVGEPSSDTSISGDVDAILNAAAPSYTVLESPGIPAAYGVWAVIGNMAISMAISAAVSFLLAKDTPPLDNRSQDSPNNQLSGRQNQVRTLQRVEDIFGTVKSIPSLLMPTYKKFVRNQEVEHGYYCVGRGYHDISQVKDGDTLVSEINGASAAVYAPFTSPNSGSPQLLIGDPIIDAIVTVRPSSSVGGIVLKPVNQLQLKASSSYLFCGPNSGSGIVPASTQDVIVQSSLDRKPNIAAVAQVGQTVTISMPDTVQGRSGAAISVDGATKTYTASVAGFFLGVVVGSTVTVGGSGWANPVQNTGAKTVTAVTDTTLTVSDTGLVTEGGVASAEFTLSINYSGTRTITEVASGYVKLANFSFGIFTGLHAFANPAETYTATITVDNGLVDWTDWFTIPDTDRTEVWTNVIAAAGMYKDDGAKQDTTVAYEVQVEKLDALFNPTGVVETVTGSITGATSSLCAETLEHVTAWTGPARVRARRTTPFDYDFGGFVQDDITWQDLYGVSPVAKAHFGNKTTIHTVTVANDRSTASATRELNCIAARKIPTYNGSSFSGTFDSTGALASGSISASSKIVDIIAAVALDSRIGNRTLADLDMAQIWSVQQALDAWNTECGQFNYTFDTDTLSFEDSVDAIANAAFCTAYRQNGKIRLALDRPQSAAVALFTHRNKKPKSETITRSFANDSEYDGIELVYADPDTDKQETIRLPLDGSYTKLKKVEITGIRSFTQAWFRANREYQRLVGQRMAIETDVTTDARALLPNVRVNVVDNTRFKSYDGEVVGQSGLTLTLSRDVAFLAGQPHSIILMKRDGSLQSITCTAGPSANQVVLATTPAETIVTAPTAEDGIRTIFSFAADSARGAQAWLVQQLTPTDDGYVRIEAVNYRDEYYTADSQAVPDKNGVINN